jgi:DNA repair protein RadC
MPELLTLLPRERVARIGPDSLSLQDAVALILGSGGQGYPLAVLAQRVAELLRSKVPTYGELYAIPGMGAAKAGAVLAALHLPSLVQGESVDDLVATPEMVFHACADLVHELQEHLVILYVNARKRVVHRAVASVGSASSSIVHPRDVFRAAILHNALSIIVAHNHPSGDPEPSHADYEVTAMLAAAGEQLGIRLVDHVVVAAQGYVSVRERAPHLFRWREPG